jgi:hypothetical protein
MPWKSILRGLFAMIAGYAAIVLVTSYGFDLVHGEKGSLWGSSPWVLFGGMVVAIIAGATGGMMAGWIGPGRGLNNAALVLLPLIVDTTYVLFFFNGTAPWWFDTIGSGTLMLFTLLGGVASGRVRRSPERRHLMTDARSSRRPR